MSAASLPETRLRPWLELTALAGALAGLGPGATIGWVALGLAAAGSALLAIALRRRLAPAGALGPALALALMTLLAATAEHRPAPEPPQALERAAAAIDTSWRGLVASLETALAETPPPGGDFTWVTERRERLGEGAGYAVLDAGDRQPLFWSGWTTPLAGTEADALLDGIGDAPVLFVLRRGLALRLALARRDASDPRLLLVAELPLPPEPDPGPLAPPAALGVEARIRWQAIGEGLRADVDTAGHASADDEEALWSLVPLMTGDGRVAGRLSLGARPAERRHAERIAARRAFCALLVALWTVATALAGWSPARTRVVVARLALLAAAPAAATWSALGDPAPWADLAWHLPGSLLPRLWDTPLAAAATGAALVGVAACGRLPEGRRWRILLGGLAAVSSAAMLYGTSAVTTRAGLGALELTGTAGSPAGRLAGIAALLLPLFAATLLGARLLAPGSRRSVLLAAMIAGIAGGAAHVLAVPDGARARVERRVLPEVRERTTTWRRALEATLDLAVPRPGSSALLPERDAIDLWWKSPLGLQGLASGVFKFDAEGALEDAFVSGLPPVTPEPMLFEPVEFPGGRVVRGPAAEALRFVGGEVPLLLAEVSRPGGGSWIAVVLADPGNLPSRAGRDPLRGLRRGARRGTVLPPSPGDAPRLAWFDGAGRMLGSDLPESPAPPKGRLAAPRWKRVRLGERSMLALEIPDPAGSGTIVCVVTPPGRLVLAAVAAGWAGLLALASMAVIAFGALWRRPRGAWRRGAGALVSALRGFRAQVALALLLVGLLPLVAVGGAGRLVAVRNARRQLVAEAASRSRDARRLVEDYLALAGSPGAALDDGIAAWLGRTLDADLFAWRAGELTATSRPDLVRAGLWPERLWGEVRSAIVEHRRALVIDAVREIPRRSAPRTTVAHAPFAAGADEGVLSIPLREVRGRITSELENVDRALLVAAVLLGALASVLTVRTTSRLSRPLERLDAATRRLAAGDFASEVPEEGFEETRQLARSFRAMASSLAAQRETLERRSAAMAALIETMPVAVLAVDPGGIVEAANAPARELLGVRPGRPLPDDRQGSEFDRTLRRTCRQMLAAAGDDQRVLELADERDQRRNLRLIARSLPFSQPGEPARLLVVEDVSDEIRSERLMAWASMARRIAHEIKNPLTPISLIVEHVRELARRNDPQLPGALGRLLDTISEQVRVLRETSREFSDYARLLVARPEPVDLAEALARWIEPYRVAAPEGVEVKLELEGELPRIEADPRLLRRAVVNLVDNALSAVGDRGRVTVRAAHDADRAEVAIIVEDDGPGIAPAMARRLFEPDVTTRETGSGLGLPIARQSIEAQGGSVELDEGWTGGARFVIRIPVRAAGPSGEDAAG